MKKISWITHSQYDIPLPKNHKFTSSKFSDLYKELKTKDFYKNAVILRPDKASVNELEIVHDNKYILKVHNVNGTLLTCKEALKNNIACHLGGGTHHAHKSFGSGYCVFNDIAYSSRKLIKENYVKRILIIDLDVHQGDGTAAILSKDREIFTCSVHCKNNFPFRKSKSDLDVELDNGLNDHEYLDILKKTLKKCMDNITPDIVIYDAGGDVHKNDKLGNLNLTSKGILERDKLVISFFKNKFIPIATVIGGGYSDDKIELAKRHSIIFQAVDEIFN